MRGFAAAALLEVFQDAFGPFRTGGGETADQRAKRKNRVQKEKERLASNRSRAAPDGSRETRQQVRAEGRPQGAADAHRRTARFLLRRLLARAPLPRSTALAGRLPQVGAALREEALIPPFSPSNIRSAR